MMTHARIRLADNSIMTTGALPAALQGLAAISLADLSWTDPALGYQGQGFWPVTVKVPTFDSRKRKLRDAYAYTVDQRAKAVTAQQLVVDLTAEEIAALPPLPVPAPAILGKLQFITLAQSSGGMTDAMLVAAQGNPAFAAFWIKYQMASAVERDSPVTDSSLDALAAGGYLPKGKAAVLAAWPTEQP